MAEDKERKGFLQPAEPVAPSKMKCPVPGHTGEAEVSKVKRLVDDPEHPGFTKEVEVSVAVCQCKFDGNRYYGRQVWEQT